MVHAEDPGLVPAGARGLPVAHKIGWLEDTDNDVAIVFHPHGPVVITIYTVGAEDSTTARFGADATSAVRAGHRFHELRGSGAGPRRPRRHDRP